MAGLEHSMITSRPFQVPLQAAKRPDRTKLDGQLVTLVSLTAAHADDLFDCTGGSEHAALWEYLAVGPFLDRVAFQEYIATIARSEDPLFFAILDSGTSGCIGYIALLNINVAHRVIEVGHVLYSGKLQRAKAGTEIMYLLARHVFDHLGYRRYEWKANNLNGPSKRAALRLGFSAEGVFRQHMIVKGYNRDTAWYSMLDSEWSVIKSAFEAWLDPANFDSQGRQRVNLAELRMGIS